MDQGMKPDAFVKQLDEARIVAAIREAESRSRGEIRVHVAARPVADARAAAEATFARLRMAGTAERNGVLVFLAPASRTFAVVGDRGIHERVPVGFWEAVAAATRGELGAGRFTDGIVAAVSAVGEELARHFPRRPDTADRNELPDTVSRD
jgi:uncharacterized membrane protein